MFLVGGPAFSGTTLLALLLNQGEIVCLDEPDFHNPLQSHRGIPVLGERFPEAALPDVPTEVLSYDDATRLIEECERAIAPHELGIKTCDWPFLGYADVYKRLGHPVMCIVRDIRDALVRPLPEWLTEERLNDHYRTVWEHREVADLVLRFEDLVTDTVGCLERVSATLGRPLQASVQWTDDPVRRQMLKLDRHDLLTTGSISDSRVGVWRQSGKTFAEETHETARLMGYSP